VTSSEKPEEAAARVFRAKSERRRAMAKLPMEEKVRIIARMRALAEEIRAITKASHKP
jgi:hypothetical protein